MNTQLRPALTILVLLTLITGVVYPLVVMGVGTGPFPHQANGSLIVIDGKAYGSKLIGQQFDDPEIFLGRISATGTFPYNAYNVDTLTGSSGSNYGPLNPALLEMVQARVDALKTADPDNTLPIPVDLVTASGSGRNPHISVAAAHGLSNAEVTFLVEKCTEGRQFGRFGESRVNVLLLNLALNGIR